MSEERGGQSPPDTETMADTSPGCILLVADNSPEMHTALAYACQRSQRTGRRVALLRVIEPADLPQWMAVGEVARDEMRAEAEALLQSLAGEIVKRTGKVPGFSIREGALSDAVMAELDEGMASVLVLGIGNEGEGPGPLITWLYSKGLERLKIPVTLVPGGLDDAAIEALD